MFLSGKLLGVLLIGVVPAGIILSKSSFKDTISLEKSKLITTNTSSRELKLNNFNDYQNNCRVITSMSTKDDINTYLFVCKTTLEESSKDINFFIYRDIDKSGKGELKKVKSFKYEVNTSVQITVTYTGGDGETEVMNVGSTSGLDKLNDVILKDKCEVSWSDYKLYCDIGGGVKENWYINEVKETVYSNPIFS